MIQYLLFDTSKLLNISDITKRIGSFFKLLIQLFFMVFLIPNSRIYQYILINLIIMDYNNQPVAPLTFKEAVTRVFNKYAQFNGRASRAEFWWFMLFCVIVGFIFGILTSISSVFAYISYLFNLAVFIPVLAVSWRRLHDIDKAGGWWFINFVPLVGFIIFIIWCAKPGVPQANRFGEVPAN